MWLDPPAERGETPERALTLLPPAPSAPPPRRWFLPAPSVLHESEVGGAAEADESREGRDHQTLAQSSRGAVTMEEVERRP